MVMSSLFGACVCQRPRKKYQKLNQKTAVSKGSLGLSFDVQLFSLEKKYGVNRILPYWLAHWKVEHLYR